MSDTNHIQVQPWAPAPPPCRLCVHLLPSGDSEGPPPPPWEAPGWAWLRWHSQTHKRPPPNGLPASETELGPSLGPGTGFGKGTLAHLDTSSEPTRLRTGVDPAAALPPTAHPERTSHTGRLESPARGSGESRVQVPHPKAFVLPPPLPSASPAPVGAGTPRLPSSAHTAGHTVWEEGAGGVAHRALSRELGPQEPAGPSVANLEPHRPGTAPVSPCAQGLRGPEDGSPLTS